MPAWNFARNIAGVQLLTELGQEHGITIRDCLNGTGIRSKDLDDPEMTISGDQELQVIKNIVSLIKDEPEIGLIAGRKYHFTTLGILGFAMASSSNLMSALEIATKYYNLTYSFCNINVSEVDSEIHVEMNSDDIPEDVRKFCIIRDAAALINIQRELLNTENVLIQTHLAIKKPTDITMYIKTFGEALTFNSKSTVIVFDKSKMQEPIAQSNNLTLMQCDYQCAKILEKNSLQSSLVSRIREKLMRDITIDMEKMASLFFMTSRTLRRQLSQEQSSFIKIRDEVRCNLAENYLSHSNLSVEETALRLGYSSSSAFISAFRRITGKTPLHFKKYAEDHQQINSTSNIK